VDAHAVYALNIDISGGGRLTKPRFQNRSTHQCLKSAGQFPPGLRRQTFANMVGVFRCVPIADIPMAALWAVNHKVEENCGSKADGWSSQGRRETYANLIVRPPSDFRGMAHAISIDSQIKPLRNADRTGDNQARAVRRQVAHDAIDHRRIVVEDNLCPVQSPLPRTSATFVDRFGTRLAHGINPCCRLSCHCEPRKNSNFPINIGSLLDKV
jgi:hypothetical protein